ncbi:MAG: hypothetical protein JWP04_66, partial [Belnapia sp.]|nr:hypothetical protein [Belnapia sp.]
PPAPIPWSAPPPPQPAEAPPPIPSSPFAVPSLAPGLAPSLATVRLQEHYATPDGGYRHLDIWLEGVRDGALAWPRLRFKLAQRGEGPVLEFRSRADWPVMFTAWPGAEADDWGPYLLVREADLAGEFLAALPQDRDRRMLAALVLLLPVAVRQAAREAPAAAAESGLWMDGAERLAAALRQAAGTSLDI